MADPTTVIVATAYALTAAPYLIVLFRILLRWLKHETFEPDDYLMLFGAVLYAVFTAAFVVAAYHGTNISQTSPRELKPNRVQYVIQGSQFLLISRVFYMSYLWTLKTCMLIYYYICLPLQTKELLAVKIAAGCLVVTWFSCTLAFFLECIPVELYWQVLPNAPQCAKAIFALFLTESTNISTNLLLMAIPLSALMRPKPPLEAKLRFSALYLFGLLAIPVSILRMKTVAENSNEQSKYIWGQLECFLATILVNGPVVHGLYRHGYNHIRKGKFGRNHCTPESELAVRAPNGLRNSVQRNEEQYLAQEEATAHEEQQSPRERQQTPSKMSDSFRRSVSEP